MVVALSVDGGHEDGEAEGGGVAGGKVLEVWVKALLELRELLVVLLLLLQLLLVLLHMVRGQWRPPSSMVRQSHLPSSSPSSLPPSPSPTTTSSVTR